MTSTLPIAEVFGPTFQGEGPSAGRLAAFIRVGGCNLTCRDCDTPYTWDAGRYDLRAELPPLSVDDILAVLHPARLVVITGGDPTLYRNYEAMNRLLGALAEQSRQVEVETNGTLNPQPMDTYPLRFNVSPKLAGAMSDDPAERRIVPEALACYGKLARLGQAVFKFVVTSPADVAEGVTLADQYEVPRRALWFMPEGTTPARLLDVARKVADPVLSAGANLTLRQHVLLWPTTERGR